MFAKQPVDLELEVHRQLERFQIFEPLDAHADSRGKDQTK
jgi:hypothetical protein